MQNDVYGSIVLAMLVVNKITFFKKIHNRWHHSQHKRDDPRIWCKDTFVTVFGSSTGEITVVLCEALNGLSCQHGVSGGRGDSWISDNGTNTHISPNAGNL